MHKPEIFEPLLLGMMANQTIPLGPTFRRAIPPLDLTQLSSVQLSIIIWASFSKGSFCSPSMISIFFTATFRGNAGVLRH